MTPGDMFFLASAAAPGSAAHEIAEQIAIIRDGAPYSLKQTPFGMLPHWQAIVFEQMLQRELADRLAGVFRD